MAQSIEACKMRTTGKRDRNDLNRPAQKLQSSMLTPHPKFIPSRLHSSIQGFMSEFCSNPLKRTSRICHLPPPRLGVMKAGLRARMHVIFK